MAKAAEMRRGEAFIFLGSTFHGGGCNRSSQDRTMHGFFYCRSYIRPEVSLPFHHCDMNLVANGIMTAYFAP